MSVVTYTAQSSKYLLQMTLTERNFSKSLLLNDNTWLLDVELAEHTPIWLRLKV